MRFLFLKRSLSWPCATGHDVHAFHMIQALAGLGHEVELALVEKPTAHAIAVSHLGGLHELRAPQSPQPTPRSAMIAPPHFGEGTGEGSSLAATPLTPSPAPPEAKGAGSQRICNGGCGLTRLQRRYLRYWGIDAAWLDGTAALVSERRPDVVVAASFDVLPCLAAAAGTTRVWYAADEYARHHLSMLRLGQPGTWRHLFEAAVAGLYERTYSAHVDRAWVVSGEERRALKFVTGIRAVDVVPNGVDAEYFQPGRERQTPRSCTFWGRLDAGPNIQAVTWFCRRVWPAVRREFPDARFAIYGFQPVPEVRSLASDSVSIIADIPDIRPVMRTHEIVVLPFVSGGGIKNKLLEAAALGLPIIASPLACGGLDGSAPIKLARSPAEWVQALRELWTDGERRRRLGADARNWVTATHTWEAAARAALAGLPALAPSPPGFAGGEGG